MLKLPVLENAVTEATDYDASADPKLYVTEFKALYATDAGKKVHGYSGQG